MPNGAGSPDCFNCQFVISIEDRRECDKHKIIIPRIGSEKLCNDWQSIKTRSKHPFRSLSSGILYYYLYASSQPPEPLDSFEHFRKPIEYFNVTLADDSQYGWSLYVGQEGSKYWPHPGKELTLQLNNVDWPFEIADAPRMHEQGGERQADGSWKTQRTVISQRIIYCPSNPNILYTWLDSLIDLEETLFYYGKKLRREFFSLVRLFILVEVDTTSQTLLLRPFIPLYGEFVRGSLKRE